jgi:hypothetical protein
MTTHTGNLIINANTTLPDLTTITGSLYVYESSTLITTESLTVKKGERVVTLGASVRLSPTHT